MVLPPPPAANFFSKLRISDEIPDLHELLGSLPPGTPIVLFCLDNSSFLAATGEGGMVPICRCVPGDSTFHVNGALVVAPERALQHSVEQLKRIVDEFPVTRFVSSPCSQNTGHANFGEPDYLSNLISDLTKLKFQLRKKLQPATIIDGIELVCGEGCGREKVEQTLRAGWALDPVHPTSHAYAKMALNLIEKVKPNPKKRKRSNESRSRCGAGPQRGPPPQQPSYSHQSGQPRDLSRDRNREYGSTSYQSGSGYGSGYGNNRQFSYPPSGYNPSRGRAGSISSRGTSGMGGNRFDSDRGGRNNPGYRGGFGDRGLPRGRNWPRW
jgi:hypothetical protein